MEVAGLEPASYKHPYMNLQTYEQIISVEADLFAPNYHQSRLNYYEAHRQIIVVCPSSGRLSMLGTRIVTRAVCLTTQQGQVARHNCLQLFCTVLGEVLHLHHAHQSYSRIQ